MGRPAKNGERYPSGKLKPTQEARIAPAMIHRIREHALSLGADPRMATELGRLLLLEQVAAIEAGAGWRMAEVYGRYERFHGIARRTASPSYEMGAGGIGTRSGEAHADARAAFDALQAHLKPFPRPHREALERLCVDDSPIGYLMVQEVRPLLVRMARQHFRTTKAPPRAEHPAAAQPDAKPKTDPLRDCFAALVTTLRPDLSGRVSEVARLYDALKDRARFRADKQRQKTPAIAMAPRDH